LAQNATHNEIVLRKLILAFFLIFVHGESRYELVVDALDANHRRQDSRVGLCLFDNKSGQRSDPRDTSKPFIPAVWKRGKRRKRGQPRVNPQKIARFAKGLPRETSAALSYFSAIKGKIS
jgi:hypothetical protein